MSGPVVLTDAELAATYAAAGQAAPVRPPAAVETAPRGAGRAHVNPGGRAPRFLGAAGINVFREECRAGGATGLTATQRAVWMWLWSFADVRGRAEVSLQSLAQVSGWHEATIKRATRVLKASGHLKLLRQGSEATHMPNLYLLRARGHAR